MDVGADGDRAFLIGSVDDAELSFTTKSPRSSMSKAAEPGTSMQLSELSVKNVRQQNDVAAGTATGPPSGIFSITRAGLALG